jgi:cbb3-type cytochrome oxidase subunit 3
MLAVSKSHEEGDMKRSTFMTVSAAASLVYGVAGLVASSQIAAIYGLTLDAQSEIVVKFLASSYLGYAVTNWLARHTVDPVAQSAIVLGNFTGWAVSLPVALYSMSVFGAHAFSWATLALQVLFTAGWGYYAFVRGGARRRAASEAGVG